MLAILAVALLLAVAASPAASTASQSDDRPPNATTYVDVSISNSASDSYDISVHVTWVTTYPARSAQAGDRADEETLDTPWFRGEEKLAAFASEYPDAEVRPSGVDTQHLSNGGMYGEINVITGTTVELQFDSDREQIVLGSMLAASLSPDDRLRVEIPHYWTPESATVESERTGVTKKGYTWWIGEGPSPRFALNESGVSSESSGGALGPSSIVPVVALALVAVILGAATRRSGGDRE